MNYDQSGLEHGEPGSFPAQQNDGCALQAPTPRLRSSHPTQIADWPFHSTPHNLSNARLIWQADNSLQSPIPPLLPILPAHRMSSTPASNTALDLSVCRQLPVPISSEEPIDMTLSSKVASDQCGDAPLALTTKVSATTNDATNHPKNLSRKLEKPKKSAHGDSDGGNGIPSLRKSSTASDTVSDTSAFDVSPRRVTRQSVRSGQAALATTTSSSSYVSPASTMEAVEGLLMLPQLSTSDPSPTDFTPAALKPLRISRKGPRPMRLQAEHSPRNSTNFPTRSEPSPRPSTLNSGEGFARSANPTSSSSEVKLVTNNASDDSQSTGDLQRNNSVVSTLIVPTSLPVASCLATTTTAVETTSGTDSVVAPSVVSGTIAIEATTQNLEKPGTAPTDREQSCSNVSSRESFRRIEEAKESVAVSEWSEGAAGLLRSVDEIDFMHSYARSKPSDDASPLPFEAGSTPYCTGSMSIDTLCLPSDAGPLLSYTGSLPSKVDSLLVDAGSMPSETDSMPFDARSMAANTHCWPSEAGSILPDTGSLPSETGSMPTETLCLPSEAGSLVSDVGSIPDTDTGHMPTHTGSTSDTGHILTHTGSTPDTGHMPMDTDSMPSDTGSTSDTAPITTNTLCMPSDAGALPADAGCMTSHAGAMSSDTGTIPSDTGSKPSDAGSMSSDAGSMAVDLNRQIASLATLDLNQTKQLILSLYRHLESLERTHLSTDDVNDPTANDSQPADESRDSDRCQHDTSHDLPVTTQASSSHSGDVCPDNEWVGGVREDLNAPSCGDIDSDGVSDGDSGTVKERSDVSFVELNDVAASLTGSEDNSRGADEVAVNSGVAEMSHANCLDESEDNSQGADEVGSSVMAESLNADCIDLEDNSCQGADEVVSLGVAEVAVVNCVENPEDNSQGTDEAVNSEVAVESDAYCVDVLEDNSQGADEAVNSGIAEVVVEPEDNSQDADEAVISIMAEVSNADCIDLDDNRQGADEVINSGIAEVLNADCADNYERSSQGSDEMVDSGGADNLDPDHDDDSGSNSQSCDKVLSSVIADASNQNRVDDSEVSNQDTDMVFSSVTAEAASKVHCVDNNSEDKNMAVSSVVAEVSNNNHVDSEVNNQGDDDEAVNSVIAEEASNASSVDVSLPPEKDEDLPGKDEDLPPGDDQLPVHVPYGAPPFEPMVTSLDGGLVEIPPDYFSVPLTTVGEYFPRHEQPVIIFVNSPRYVETTALANPHLGSPESHAPPIQSEGLLTTNQQVTPMEPDLPSNQQVTVMEPHLPTSQCQVTPVQPHLIANQNVPLMESYTCTSEQVLLLEQLSITTQPVSTVPDAPHSHQVSVLEPVVLASQQVTSVQPHLHVQVLTEEQVSILEPSLVSSQQVSLLEPQSLTDNSVVPFELAVITSQRGSLPEPQSIASQSISPLEPTTFSSHQNIIPLPGVGPPTAAEEEDSSGWVYRGSYQSSLKLEAISPPSSVMSTNDVEDDDAEESFNADVFGGITRDLERNSDYPSMEVGGKNEHLVMNYVEDAESSSAFVFESVEELERNASHPFMEAVSEQLQVYSDEANREGLESDCLAHEVEERNTSVVVVSTSLEYVADTVELECELQCEVVHFQADDLTEVVANEEVETVDLHNFDDDDEESQESLSLRLSISSDEDAMEFDAIPSDSFTKIDPFFRHVLTADKSHFAPICSSSTQVNKIRGVSDGQSHTDTRRRRTKKIARDMVSDEETTENDDCFLNDSPDNYLDQMPENIRANDTTRVRSSNENLIELCAETLGTHVRVNPNLLPKDITSLFNCSVVVKMLKLSQPPCRETEKKEESTVGIVKRKRGRPPKHRVLQTNDGEIGKTVCTSEASATPHGKRMLEQTSGKTGKGLRRKRWQSLAGEASAGVGVAGVGAAEVQHMIVAQSSNADDGVKEPVETGLIKIGDSLKTFNKDPAYEPISTVHLNQEDDHSEQLDRMAVDMNSQRDYVVVVQTPSVVDMNCMDNTETGIHADGCFPISLDHQSGAGVIIIDSVATQDTTITALPTSQLSCDINAGEEKTKSGAEGDNRKVVQKKICRISVSGLSKPPKLLNSSPSFRSTSSMSNKSDPDLPVASTSTSASFNGVSLNQQKDLTPIILEVASDVGMTVEPRVITAAQNGKEERNIFQIQMPLMVGSPRVPAVSAESERVETPESVNHDISKTVFTLRTIFQEVAQRAENRERLVPATTSERKEGILLQKNIAPVHSELVLRCGETSGEVDLHQVVDLDDREIGGDVDLEDDDVDLEGGDVETEEAGSQAEGKRVCEIVTPVEAGEMLVHSSGTNSSSETMASASETMVSSETMASASETIPSSSETIPSSGETPSNTSEMLVSSDAAVNVGECFASLSETTVLSVARSTISRETTLASLSETLVNSCETLDNSVSTVISFYETPSTPNETADNSIQTRASSEERMVTCDVPIITFVEPSATDFVETIELNNDNDETIELNNDNVETIELNNDNVETIELNNDNVETIELNNDSDDDNENNSYDPIEFPMEEDDISDTTCDTTFDSKENPTVRFGWDNKIADEQSGGLRKRKSTDPNDVYAVQTNGTKRPRLMELNYGQPCEMIRENETAFSGSDQNQPTAVAHGKSGSPRRKVIVQIGKDGYKSCEELMSCDIVQHVGDGDKPMPCDMLRRGQGENTLDGRFSLNGEDRIIGSVLIHQSDSQVVDRTSTALQPQNSCLWEFLDTGETGRVSSSSPISQISRNQSPHYENRLNRSPESVNATSSPVSHRPVNSMSQQICDDDDIDFTTSNVELLESLNTTTDVVVRKLPINCPLIKCTAVSVLSRAISGSVPGMKHLQCLFCHSLASTMKGITSHLEQRHADIVNFAVSKVNPSKDFAICYFCRHCQFVATDRVVIWIHFQATHNILGILESSASSHDSVPAPDDPTGCSARLDLSLDSPVHWYRVFMCPECNGLTDNEATMALHMTNAHPLSLHSNGHFVKVVALLRPRNHFMHLTYRMLLMDDAYVMNRKNCFVCLLCYFVIFDPRLALSHFLSLHSDMKLLLICKSDACEERFVREKAFVEHYKQRHRPKTVPMNFNCSVTLVTKLSAERGATEVTFTDDD